MLETLLVAEPLMLELLVLVELEVKLLADDELLDEKLLLEDDELLLFALTFQVF